MGKSFDWRMRIKSKSQFIKFMDMKKKGEITSKQAEGWFKGVKYHELPDRLNEEHIPKMWRIKKE